MLLSVVVPCYNEAPVLRETHRRLLANLEPLGPFEIVYVDDGSSDETASILRALSTADSRNKVVRLSRNFGQQIASTAGLEHASGDAVVLIDADLQDPPELIGELHARWREGWQVVYGKRNAREGEAPLKRWSAALFYRLSRRFFPALPLDAGDFRLLDRSVVDAILRMPERDRFLRGMISWAGYRQVGVPYRRAPRQGGESNYSTFKMLRLASDALISFSPAPLRLVLCVAAIAIGGLSVALALAGLFYAAILRSIFPFMHPIAGWSPVLAAVLLLGGLQSITLGLIGEYLGRIYGEAKRRPLYFVAEKLGFETSSPPQSMGTPSPPSSSAAARSTEANRAAYPASDL